MKKKIFFLIICNFFVAIIKAQTNVYHPFPDSNAVWRVNYEECQMPPLYPTLKFQYLMYGDTLINSFNYKKIKREGDCCLYIEPAGPYFQNNGYIGALRDDTTNKKIYIMLKDSTNETLLYNFSLTVGDTLFGLYAAQSICQLPNGFLIVQSVDSVFIDNSYRKRINFINPIAENFASIIEGVGSNKGLFEGFYFHADCCDRNLVCFKVNNVLIYPDTATSFSCDLLLEINTDKPIINTFKIFPNPSSENIIIDFSNSYNISEIKIKCFDIFGQEEKIEFTEQDNQIIIETKILKNGVHFLSIYDNGKPLRNEKIIINHTKQ